MEPVDNVRQDAAKDLDGLPLGFSVYDSEHRPPFHEQEPRH